MAAAVVSSCNCLSRTDEEFYLRSRWRIYQFASRRSVWKAHPDQSWNMLSQKYAYFRVCAYPMKTYSLSALVSEVSDWACLPQEAHSASCDKLNISVSPVLFERVIRITYFPSRKYATFYLHIFLNTPLALFRRFQIGLQLPAFMHSFMHATLCNPTCCMKIMLTFVIRDILVGTLIHRRLSRQYHTDPFPISPCFSGLYKLRGSQNVKPDVDILTIARL